MKRLNQCSSKRKTLSLLTNSILAIVGISLIAHLAGFFNNPFFPCKVIPPERLTIESAAGSIKLSSAIIDTASILDENSREVYRNLANQLRTTTGIQFVVLTVSHLGGESIQAFASRIFHQWELGEKGSDNGVLLVFAVAERRVRLEVGYGLEGELTDLSSHRLLAQNDTLLETGNYSLYMKKLVNDIYQSLNKAGRKIGSLEKKSGNSDLYNFIEAMASASCRHKQSAYKYQVTIAIYFFIHYQIIYLIVRCILDMAYVLSRSFRANLRVRTQTRRHLSLDRIMQSKHTIKLMQDFGLYQVARIYAAILILCTNSISKPHRIKRSRIGQFLWELLWIIYPERPKGLVFIGDDSSSDRSDTSSAASYSGGGGDSGGGGADY